MLTGAGWKLLGAAVLTLVVARVFALIELYVLGAAGAAAVLVSLLVRICHPSRLRIARRVSAELVPVGQDLVVEFAVANVSRLRSPEVLLSDPVVGVGDDFIGWVFAAPLKRSQQALVSYTVSTSRRGELRLGPLTVDDQDQLGLARRRLVVPRKSRVIVHPRLEELNAGLLFQEDSVTGKLRPNWGAHADEFDGLRQYTMGDDPRHIHWASTARLDQLTVRQFRPPVEHNVGVLIDTRPPGDGVAAQDCTTQVAASLIRSILQSEVACQIVTTDGRGTAELVGVDQMANALEFCALLSGGSEQIVERHNADSTADSTILVSAVADLVSDPEARSRFAGLVGAQVVITCDVTSWARTSGRGVTEWNGNWIHLTASGQLNDAWKKMVTETSPATWVAA